MVDFLNEYEKRLADFQPHQVVCGGDINLNILDISNQHTNLFHDYIESLCLQQIINEPTRVTKTSCTLLDIILIPCEVTNFDSGVQDVGIPDHFLTYFTLENAKTGNNEIFKCRNLKNIDRENIIYLENINDKVTFLNDCIINIFDTLAPSFEIKVKNKRPPWLTFTIKNMIKLKDKAYKKYLKHRNDVNWNSYKQLKNQTNIAIREEKKQYLQHTINNTIGNSKLFWKKLNNLNVHSSRQHIKIPDNLNKPTDINNHFLSSNSNNSVDIDVLNFYNNTMPQITSLFHFVTVSEDTVRKHLFELNSVATGADQINLDMILLCIDGIVPFVTNIINTCVLENSFPDPWKISKVYPLCKKKKRRGF